MVKVIVAGSREFKDYSKMANTLIAYFMNKSYSPDDVEIISGTAGGADRLGERFADKAGCKLTRMPADWDGLGKKAGYIRNWDMAKYAGSDGVCFCFWDGKSKGTKHMIDLARKEGLEVHVIIFS